MVQPGFGGLDTPRTNLGDATYLSTHRPDFDMTQEPSFVSPSKDANNNLLQQLRNGRSGASVSLRTPRGRGPFNDRRNMPASLGGAEFTPLLKSATRNSARRHGKENGFMAATPALDRIAEDDVTTLPSADASTYGTSRHASYIDSTMPVVDTSSTASTPLGLPARRPDGKGFLDDGNQLSLREQENVIDKIEKENFGLKLKIHFLEEALRKAGPGFSEAALKENTELKVDKVTMQRELHRYKKHLTTAERDLETYRQQMVELHERAKRKYADENQRLELDSLRKSLETKEADLQDLRDELDRGHRDQDQLDKLHDEIADLEADLREKDRMLGERDDEMDDLREKLESEIREKDRRIDDHEDELEELKAKLKEAEEESKDARRRLVELEEKMDGQARSNDELEDARDTIDDLERNNRQLEEQLDDMKEKLEKAATDKERAEAELEELQEEMSNKSIVTKGLSRQIEDKALRLQQELDRAGDDYASLEKKYSGVLLESDELKARLKDARREREASDRELQVLKARYDELKSNMDADKDKDDLLRSKHDALAREAADLKRETTRLQNAVADLEEDLAREKDHALALEGSMQNQYKDEIERLNDEISDLQAEIRERDNLYDNDSEKWESERRTLVSERDRAEEKATGLEKTVDKLRAAEGALSGQEAKLQQVMQSEADRHKREESVLARQIDDLQKTLDSRQAMLTELRNELSAVRDDLRQAQVDREAQAKRTQALEDEVEVLQASLEDGSDQVRQNLEASRRECEILRDQLQSLRQTTTTSRETASNTAHSADRLRTQLDSTTAQLAQLGRDKQSLQDQLATVNIDLHELRSTLAETKAERDELQSEIRRAQQHGEATLRVDQERIDLRTAKIKLENEARRLREENKMLSEERQAMEKSLEDEIEKAAEEEERLNQEIMQMQARLRQFTSSDSHEITAARRTIRELERRIEDYEMQLARTQTSPARFQGEGNSELSLIRRDLTEARQKELEHLQREATQKEVVRGLKRQVADLERQMHEAETSRIVGSPVSSSSARKAEAVELRHQLTTARRTIHDLEAKLREAERKASHSAADLQSQLEELEDQRFTLEQALEDARNEAEATATQHERAARKLQHKLEKAERQAQAATATAKKSTDKSSANELRHLQEMIRSSATETEALEHDVLQQQQTIDALLTAEATLRRKLERARSERAAYRLSAEKLQRDAKRLRLKPDPDHLRLTEVPPPSATPNYEMREKEMRGVRMQMGWMQARWEREAKMRADASYAKQFLQLQLDVANACNKAQLRELTTIQTDILGAPPAQSSSSSAPSPRNRFRSAISAIRFIVRARRAAQEWAVHEETRRKLAACVKDMRRGKAAVVMNSGVRRSGNGGADLLCVRMGPASS